MADSWLQDAWSELGKQPDWIVDVVVPVVILHVMYYGLGFFFLALDNTRWRVWDDRKCQRRAKPIPWPHVRKIVAVVGSQLLTVYPVALALLAPFSRARLSYSAELPDLTTVLWSFACFALCSEAYFFHVHWLLHHPRLYPHIHKFHHEYTAPIALECLYFHPVSEEAAKCNRLRGAPRLPPPFHAISTPVPFLPFPFLPSAPPLPSFVLPRLSLQVESVLQLGVIASGPLLIGSHVTLMWAFEVLALYMVSLHHCGHEVPMDDTPGLGSMTQQHDYHHKVIYFSFLAPSLQHDHHQGLLLCPSPCNL